jgi:hypothetical protein
VIKKHPSGITAIVDWIKNSFKLLMILLLIDILAAGLVSCRTTTSPPQTILTLEEHPLEGPPDADQRTFQPTDTSQEAVLEAHQAERNRTIYNPIAAGVDFQVVMSSLGSGEQMSAVLRTSAEEPPRQVVDVMREDQVIFSLDAGLPSPALPLQSFWTQGEHWFLEILLADEDIWNGQIYWDGNLINDLKDYQEAFGFQLLADKPFFFFQKHEKMGYSYDGQEYSLPYSQILHYGCCSASTLNPIPAENMVAFYALAGDQWFYVELGDF